MDAKARSGESEAKAGKATTDGEAQAIEPRGLEHRAPDAEDTFQAMKDWNLPCWAHNQ